MKKLLAVLQYIANVVLVLLTAWVLGFDLGTINNKYDMAVYLFIALLLYGAENWLIDRIQGKS